MEIEFLVFTKGLGVVRSRKRLVTIFLDLAVAIVSTQLPFIGEMGQEGKSRVPL